MPRGKGITKRAWVEAVRKCSGIVRDIAKELGIHRSNVTNKRKRNPWLQKIFDEVVEDCLDKAESVVNDHLDSKDIKTARWYLDRKGQSRGYGHKLQLDADVNQTGQVHLYLPDNGRDSDESEETTDNPASDDSEQSDEEQRDQT